MNQIEDNSMTKPTIAQYEPFPIEVEEGKEYYWCACGDSKNQPFCDGSHVGTEFMPLSYKSLSSETVYFCGCKQTSDAPECDGTHESLA